MSQGELDQNTSTAENAPESEVQLEGGTYEIIRNRLSGYGDELRKRLAQLNTARKDVFGSIETKLLNTERITTEHNCIPRDMVAVGDRFMFGYNVHFGLKSERHIGDVFAAYEFRDHSFHHLPLDLISDEQFAKDFQEIYRYYKNAVFSKFFLQGPFLFMNFRIGKSVDDIKVFKWAIEGDRLVYVDNRSEHEVRYPPQHDFEWTRTTRDQHQHGVHPHVSIDDRVFVETVGGDLTIKVEDNTESGEGVYSEPVDNVDQVLDDAEIHYAIVGHLILLKIRPYQEQKYRYFVFNEKIQQAIRLDAIQHACIMLPDDQGLIFSNGYYLQTGEFKTFDHQLTDMIYERQIASPNGEDFLYIFYNRESGVHALLQYNLIEQRVDTPVICSGSTFFRGGELVLFKAHADAQKHHAVQLWQTPFVGEDYVPDRNTDSFLYKVGNKEIVRAMAECHEALTLVDKEDTYANLYVDLVRETTDILDSYFWIDDEQMFRLSEPLSQIRSAATAAVDEYEKVVRVKKNTAKETERVRNKTHDIISDVNRKRFEKIDEFVSSLSDLRKVRGEIVALRDLRYADASLIDKLEASVSEEGDRLAKRCVRFLLEPAALTPYRDRVDSAGGQIDGLQKTSEAKKVDEEVTQCSTDLEMLIEIVSNLAIDDATQRTKIIDDISEIFSTLNTVRARLKKRIEELQSVEGVAEFGSQIKLLNQSVVNYLDLCDTPEKCDEYLTKLMVQIEELEGNFAEFDEFIGQLVEKRDEVYNAFESRKLALIEKRNRRANSLMQAADRILKGIKSRVGGFDSITDIHGYYASDLMIDKVRDICEELKEAGDSVKVDEIQSRLKTIREDAVRQLKDRQELFVDGENVIRLGRHQFTVNTQPLDLTTVVRDGVMQLHLTGTDFFESITDDELVHNKDLWTQEVVSENRTVYRAEFLAYQFTRSFTESTNNRQRHSVQFNEEELLSQIQQFMGPRYAEGYVKGVHDLDATKLVQVLLKMESHIGLLRHRPQARATARVYWQEFAEKPVRAAMSARLRGIGTLAELFPNLTTQEEYIAELRHLLSEFVTETGLFCHSLVDDAAVYLYEQLVCDAPFVVSRMAADLVEHFRRYLDEHGFSDRFDKAIKSVQRDQVACFALIRDWVEAFLHHRQAENEADYADEVAAVLMQGELDLSDVVDVALIEEIQGLVGSHPRVHDGRLHLNYYEFMQRLRNYAQNVVPKYFELHEAKKRCVEQSRHELKLEEFRPRVLTSFVRNKLIDSVYLPMIGDNLAKQVGVAGEQKRTDRMGLLLLISPPGYGKTTLMEYIANRLGVIFMKINGPAIGHQVTSLDPAEATNAGAREEVEKLNLAFEMGDNVMIYLDDIQHCHPELLQKFISLCDAQRKIEGVYKGRTRTYDFRGRKVAVVMAGNPYTESGEKFQIPDMLANRADIYNLGEIIGDSADAFEMSYLENCLTSNPVLNQLATRSQKDIYAIIRMAEREDREGVELEGNYSIEELNDMVAIMKMLMTVRDVVLKVNRAYIHSAAQADDYRTEPAFKLQGSYRNMNRIAERVVPIMNDEELWTLIISNYENDAQTLTTGAEANLLKFKELIGRMSDVEAERWADIKKTFVRNVKMRGVGADDKVGQVIVQISTLADGLDSIRDAMQEGMVSLREKNGRDTEIDQHVHQLIDSVNGIQEGLAKIGEALAGGMSQIAERTATSDVPAPGHRQGMTANVVDATSPKAGDVVSPNTLTVVNKIPPTLLRVVQQQFKLMHGWMEPLLKMSQEQGTDLRELRDLIDNCLKDYARLVERVERSRN